MSWKTTLFGSITALGAYLSTIPGIPHQIGVVLGIAGPAAAGFFARDNDKSSEDAGLKK